MATSMQQTGPEGGKAAFRNPVLPLQKSPAGSQRSNFLRKHVENWAGALVPDTLSEHWTFSTGLVVLPLDTFEN